MQTGRDFNKIIEAARLHYENLKTDIVNAKDRVEHIRLTALAQEAHNVLTDLEVFSIGLVYTHTADTTDYILNMHQSTAGAAVPQTELDLPEFRNPFAPPQPEV